ncbi:unnamed protein product, partial [Amoebophrya sp. A25]
VELDDPVALPSPPAGGGSFSYLSSPGSVSGTTSPRLLFEGQHRDSFLVEVGQIDPAGASTTFSTWGDHPEQMTMAEIEQEYLYLESTVRFDRLPYLFTPALLSVLAFVAVIFAIVDGVRELEYGLTDKDADALDTIFRSNGATASSQDATGRGADLFNDQLLLALTGGGAELRAVPRSLGAASSTPGAPALFAGSAPAALERFNQAAQYLDVCGLSFANDATTAGTFYSALLLGPNNALHLYERSSA